METAINVDALCTPFALVLQSVVYLLGVYLLWKAMATRAPFECKQIMRVYNVAQIAVCGYMTIGARQAGNAGSRRENQQRPGERKTERRRRRRRRTGA